MPETAVAGSYTRASRPAGARTPQARGQADLTTRREGGGRGR
jgi:hypothetical protein